METPTDRVRRMRYEEEARKIAVSMCCSCGSQEHAKQAIVALIDSVVGDTHPTPPPALETPCLVCKQVYPTGGQQTRPVWGIVNPSQGYMICQRCVSAGRDAQKRQEPTPQCQCPSYANAKGPYPSGFCPDCGQWYPGIDRARAIALGHIQEKPR